MIHGAISAYAKVVENLCRHDPAYPEAGLLQSLVGVGNGNDLTGAQEDSPGSQMLERAMLRNDPRPVWVAVWGGSATVARAVVSLAKRLDRVRLAETLSRVWVYEIQGQDDCGAWLAANYPELNWIRSQTQWRGISNRVDGAWPETRRHLDEFVGPRWFDQHIREGHGPLGDLYPHARFLFEGDTPSFLHLIPNGLHEPTAITQGGWGGRFMAAKSANVWSGGCPVNDEGRFAPFEMFTDAADALRVGATGKLAWNVINPVRRWREAYQNDFAARMDWCLGKPSECSHAPVAIVDGEPGRGILRRRISPGLPLKLDASQSRSECGQELEFRWWVYSEAGSLPARLDGADSAAVIISPETDQISGEAHVILETVQPGDPPLRAYRRVIVTPS